LKKVLTVPPMVREEEEEVEVEEEEEVVVTKLLRLVKEDKLPERHSKRPKKTSQLYERCELLTYSKE